MLRDVPGLVGVPAPVIIAHEQARAAIAGVPAVWLSTARHDGRQAATCPRYESFDALYEREHLTRCRGDRRPR
jgi:hypothetical protein